jgi:hypothetical protein
MSRLHVEQCDDVRAADARERLGLDEEPGLDHARGDAIAAALVAEQALDRDRASDPAIVGFVDDGVASSAVALPWAARLTTSASVVATAAATAVRTRTFG